MDIIKDDLKFIFLPTCRKCGVILTDENWYVSHKKIHKHICKECECKRARKWRQDNIDRHNQLKRESNHRLIDEVIDVYGGKCACCGETRREYLTIDHVNGGGNKQKREMGFLTSQVLYRWLKQNNYPKGFQVLCFNCNCGKRNYSVCPHNKEIFEKKFGIKLKESKYARYTWKLRLGIIKGYGGKCELCGEDNPHFLTVDHTNGGGRKERKIFGGPLAFYRKLRDENYPKGNYRLLCYNCNCALGFNRITEDNLINLRSQERDTKNDK